MITWENIRGLIQLPKSQYLVPESVQDSHRDLEGGKQDCNAGTALP